MATDNTVQQLAGAVLPTALRELLGAQGQIKEIAEYFEQAYAADADKNKVFSETQVYTKNALGNVAFHVNVVGSHMVSFLNKQFDELDTMQLQFDAVMSRLNNARYTLGLSNLSSYLAPRIYKTRPVSTPLKGDAVPEGARMLDRYERRPVDLSSLDDVGITLPPR
ncbi:uncharacterized protein AMSG_09736 [Thecamonas trahens ATCC 50062]|uniref:Uncharacterized protein n=1 Tax=Thecamonas trahens ATCC 50062 TaxID=461836 RepID=A0A0L0DPZ6_THETB|nr:hypothetical protein AMSG_09736 [Thecamonas trahens ATCC 50062]KNC54071.1 hypothetical protein AMSG_09736 [Thecamonas trahens ATCC 50062]|eukprot:XP_013754080.1 hypothetical protein AMSG_09736 [Thecamonas trahens ATCC 50062]